MIDLDLKVASCVEQQLGFVLARVRQQVTKVVFHKRLDLIKGPSSYKGCCPQHLLLLILEHGFVKPNVQFRLHKECFKFDLVAIIGVRQGHLDLSVLNN